MVHMTILSNGSSHALGDSSHFTNRLVDTFHISHKKIPDSEFAQMELEETG